MTIAGLDFASLTRIFGDAVSVTWERYLKVDKSRPISHGRMVDTENRSLRPYFASSCGGTGR
jgi:hypothetical protein